MSPFDGSNHQEELIGLLVFPAGLLNGRPTIVVPFFGDQEFWGEMVAKAGGGPPPYVGYPPILAFPCAESLPFGSLFARIHSKKLTSELLVEAINFCMTSEAQTAARKMGDQIRAEVSTHQLSLILAQTCLC